jgi:hypothetical protein
MVVVNGHRCSTVSSTCAAAETRFVLVERRGASSLFQINESTRSATCTTTPSTAPCDGASRRAGFTVVVL